MLAAFKGPCPDSQEGCHNDGNNSNNALTNLRYDTKVNNHADKRKHGTHLEGERCPHAVLTEAEVRQIRQDSRDHETIAENFGVSRSQIRRIIRRENWAHV